MPASLGTEQPHLVLDLAELGAELLPQVGGKAANLGEIIRAGLPVPPGFCVTTQAYRRVADSVAIDFDSFGIADPESLKRTARAAREGLLAVPIPEEIARAVADAYARQGRDVPVAVRSSATAEDLPFASFAGQQDTFLHVIGREALLDAVRRCWASLWTDRAVVYRSTNSIDPRTVRLAVVVQRMIEARVAGVLFTANPVTGHRRQAVIDASPGLGEAVVSGAVNPDRFTVDTEGGAILERRLGDKRVEIVPVAGGGTRQVERSAGSDQACLADDQLRALASLGEKVEEHYGSPQDIEYVVDPEGRIWLTQSRPITTLFPLPVGPGTPRSPRAASGEEDLRVYFCFSVAQGLYRPITPMGLAAFRMLGSSVSSLFGFPVADPREGPHRYADAAGRVFIDLTGIIRGRVGHALMPRVFDVMEARSAAILRHLYKDPRFSITRQSRMGFVRRALRVAVKFRIPLTLVRSLANPEWALSRAERIGVELARRLEPPVATGDALSRLDRVERILTTEIIAVAPNVMPLALAGIGMFAFAGKLLEGDAAAEDLQTVLRGLPNNVTTTMDLELWGLSAHIRKDDAAAQALLQTPAEELAKRFRAGGLPPVAQKGLAEFLSRYGHRAVAEIDIGMPRWSDDPAHVLGVLANYLRVQDPEQGADTVFRRGEKEAEAMVESLIQRARRRGPLRARLLRFALSRARKLTGLRELPKFYIVVVLGAVRRELQAVGAELARRGCIENGEDVFFLNLAEARIALTQGGDFRPLIEQRRQSYEMELRRRHLPRVLLSDGTEPETEILDHTASGDSLIGTAASAGKVTGIARVILDPVGARLEPGEILVAPSTDPGWTPLFLTAGGLVMEMGGANSHGAVVAREYGIPAVVGVFGATQRITTGQRIQVDGTSGVVDLQP
jgi:phosphohistidine swiveling domain-containing protein